MKNTILILSLIFFAFSAQAQINYNNNSISGDYSGALGSDNSVSGNNSLAAGYISNISGNYSFSLGYNNTVTDDGAFAIGTITTAESIGAISIGNKLKTTGSYAVTIGKGHHNGYLVNNISSSLMIGFQSDIPTFFVGAASGPGTVGKVGVGTTNPVALLDVNGDINLSGNILKNGSPMKFSPWTKQGSSLYYTNGKVGIGTSLPSYSLDIRGNFNVSGAIYQNGQPFNPSLWEKAGGNISFSGGNVGIGTITPSEALEVNGTVKGSRILTPNFDSENFQEGLWSETGNNVYFNNGKVGIGTQSPEEKLHINNGKLLISNSGTELLLSGNDMGSAGGEIDFYHPSSGFNTLNCERIWARDEIVVNNNDPWPDYVFESQYNLMPIEELENYIRTHSKLPKMPSAEEVKENGQELAQNQALLLEKTEELTLYIIELKKENEALRARIEKLEGK